MPIKKEKTEVVVIGAGPGGYAAAFYAADRGKKVTLVEQSSSLGGVCLNRGCIPSKALLHAARVIRESADSAECGIQFSKPKINLGQLRNWKNDVIGKLAGGVQTLAKSRGVSVITGRGYFEDDVTLRIETEKGQQFLTFETAIIAVGSRPAIPAAFDLGNKRIMTSTEALDIEDVPQSLLVVGGGYIGMELGTVYSAMGSQVSMVEALPSILQGADADLIRPVKSYAESHFKSVRLDTKVEKMATKGKQIEVTLNEDGKRKSELYDRVLVSIGRTPNTTDVGLENIGINLDAKGFIEVDEKQRTAKAHIYAIGDVAGGALLAHKASKEARIAVDTMLGSQAGNRHDVVIPAVVFTDPEIAWAGLTETEAREHNIKVNVARFPWAASGRAMTLNRTDGLTKFILEPETDRVLGVGIVGVGAGDLISEGVLAIEMGATAEDVAESIHPHPTLSETIMESAEAFYGYATHTYSPKRS